MNWSVNRQIRRIIDANLNRSREGLRVCEDVARFILNSPALTGELKSVRHSISGIIKSLPYSFARLLESRNSEEDVGRASKCASEMSRRNTGDIFFANMERVKESLRVLEEFFKLVDKNISSKFSRLRFKAYDIEKKALGRILSLRNTR